MFGGDKGGEKGGRGRGGVTEEEKEKARKEYVEERDVKSQKVRRRKETKPKGILWESKIRGRNERRKE